MCNAWPFGFYLSSTVHKLVNFLQYTSVKPLGDRVLVKTKTTEDKTAGGILLPTTAQSRPQAGEVVAVGEGRSLGSNIVEISVPVCTLFG